MCVDSPVLSPLPSLHPAQLFLTVASVDARISIRSSENERLQSVYFWYDKPGEGDDLGGAAAGSPGAGAGGTKFPEKKEKKRGNPKLDIGAL